MVVVATTADGVAAVGARLAQLGAPTAEILEPSADRRLALAAVEDECEAERLLATLRGEGQLVVARPDGGVRLEAWVQHTRPLIFGDRITVCFAWSEHDRGDLPAVIELGAGGFGNGEHPATRLVIDVFVERIAGGERVLDVGCGSGVLGLCALALGASGVVAVDIKPEAVDATCRNAMLNGMGSRTEASIKSVADIDGRFDVVVANVGRAAIVDLAPELVAARVTTRLAGSQRNFTVTMRTSRRVSRSTRRTRTPNVG